MNLEPSIAIDPKQGQSLNERTERALHQAPFFGPPYLQHNVDQKRFSLLAKNMDSALEKQVKPAPMGALNEAEHLSLVKASKCPTRALETLMLNDSSDQTGQTVQTFPVIDCRGETVVQVGSQVFRAPDCIRADGQRWDVAALAGTGELKPASHKSERGAGCRAVVSHREWSGEYRIRTQTETGNEAPPEQSGTRYTDTLSLSGARKIADSCHYMAVKKGGYSTFLTLTFDGPGRQRIANRVNDARCTEIEWIKGKPVPVVQWLASGRDMTFSTIQDELSRFWDAVNKTYQRGFVATKTYPWGVVDCISKGKTLRATPSAVIGWKGAMVGSDGKAPKGGPVRDSIHYCWVAENPTNERGQENPHVHILMRWQVPYRLFGVWATRVESLWGQGFARLEKIKDPEKAGAYMAKAAGYMTKSAGASDQGRIRGNRYGISKPSRAPDWECLGLYEAGIMGSLIKDTHDYFSYLYGHHFRARKQLNEKLAETPKKSRARRSIVAALEKVRGVLNALPAVAAPYQITFKSLDAMKTFTDWASDDTGAKKADWLPVKDAGDRWSDDPADKSKTLWGAKYEQRHRERAQYLENQKRRRWERWTGGDLWWAAVMDWERDYEAVPEYGDEGQWERQNWGFV